MKRCLVYLSLFFLISCHDIPQHKSFYYKTFPRWTTSEKIIFDGEKYFPGRPLRGALGTWELFVEIYLGKMKDCLFYQQRNKSKSSSLKIVSVPSNQKCMDKALIAGVMIEKLEGLTFQFGHEFVLQGKLGKKKLTLKYPLINYVKSKNYEAFSNPSIQRRYEGVRVIPD